MGANRSSIHDAVVLQVAVLGQHVGQMLNSSTVSDLQVLDLPANHVICHQFEVLMPRCVTSTSLVGFTGNRASSSAGVKSMSHLGMEAPAASFVLAAGKTISLSHIARIVAVSY